PDGGCGLHLCRLCRRRLQPCLRFRLRPRQPAATYTSTSASASPRLLATNTTEASLTSATDCASRRIRPLRGRGCADLNARYHILQPYPPATLQQRSASSRSSTASLAASSVALPPASPVAGSSWRTSNCRPVCPFCK
uniref:Uncharacterized protein n=1 Tax=Oryza rufipogon TaxID=4529 RepID=A0A0E0PW28_ORYRU